MTSFCEEAAGIADAVSEKYGYEFTGDELEAIIKHADSKSRDEADFLMRFETELTDFIFRKSVNAICKGGMAWAS